MSPIEDRKLIIDEAAGCARRVLQLECGLVELITKGSLEPEILGVDCDPPREYNPHKHEACRLAALPLIYEHLRKRIKQEKKIIRIIKEAEAEFYTLTKPTSFGGRDDIQLVMFPVIFYKPRKYQ